ncbi:MAG: hypothetical protein ACI934_002251 [Pseudohongiellaceae bacterium]|jgi:uncharacterized protein (DUF934 family)
MPTLIKDGQVTDNTWDFIEKESDLSSVLSRASEQVLVPLSLWQEHKSDLQASEKDIGVWLDSDDDTYELGSDALDLPLIALNFPVFMDGRSYSSAAILRKRIGYKGELRAVGEILRDQLFYMKKCGINSFEISDSVKLEDALAAFSDFSNSYQSTIEDPLPLFRRR